MGQASYCALPHVKGREMDLILELPWPPKELSPNARGHWRKSEDAKQKYKADCWALTKAFLFKNPGKYYTQKGKLPISIMFHPPTRRGYDADNLNSRMKYGFDGIAEALCVNDKIFRPVTYDIADEPVKHGKVVVKILTGHIVIEEMAGAG
jgi:crossover junction endodeoxyribonuclease RusA